MRVGEAFMQVAHQGSTGSSPRVTFAIIQAVQSVIASRVRASELYAQVIHNGDIGAMLRDTFNAVQVVYTIGVADSTRQRAWTFDFDGHTFYVLDMGTSGALIFDLTTGQWSRFDTAGYDGHWNFKNGFQWRDGKMVVGGDAVNPTIHKIDPGSFLDEGWRPVVYEVRGVLGVQGVGYRRQYTLRLVGSAGKLADETSPTLKMRFSDDQGDTWSDEHSLTLQTDTRQRLEFRSLGAFTAPGRIFRLYDEGGVKFIAYVEADIGGEDADTPA